MTEPRDVDAVYVDAVNAALHELTEGLQATGSYLSAVRRSLNDAGKAGSLEADFVEKALSQWGRAGHAVRELRAELAILISPTDE